MPVNFYYHSIKIFRKALERMLFFSFKTGDSYLVPFLRIAWQRRYRQGITAMIIEENFTGTSTTNMQNSSLHHEQRFSTNLRRFGKDWFGSSYLFARCSEMYWSLRSQDRQPAEFYAFTDSVLITYRSLKL